MGKAKAPSRKQIAERKARTARHELLASFVLYMRGWSAAASGGPLSAELTGNEDAVSGYEDGLGSRLLASTKRREKLKISREELGAFLSRQAE